ncbi:MAG: BglG family transcription antiterminator [Enterobacteriaceae bacterium]
MNLDSYPRLSTLFDAIRSEQVPQEELARRLAVSTRTIRSDISLLNDILGDYGASVSYERGKGYSLSISDGDALKRLQGVAEPARMIPRSAKARREALLCQFLLTSHPLRLEELAEKWCVSRGTLQGDMTSFRERLADYNIVLQPVTRQGIRAVGEEYAIRACFTDLLWQQFSASDNQSISEFQQATMIEIDLVYIDKVVRHNISRFDIKLTRDGLYYFIFNCAVAILRVTCGHEFVNFAVEESVRCDPLTQEMINELCTAFAFFLGEELSRAERRYLLQQIMVHQQSDSSSSHEGEQAALTLSQHIVDYINDSYNYDLRHDEQLKRDLCTHLSAMLTRNRYQIATRNPLLDEIKQYYPFAYDVTLSALNSAGNLLLHPLSEDEMGFVAVHIGVGLERHYGTGYTRYPSAMIVSDAGNATIRMIEGKISRQFPQLKLEQVLSQDEYQQLPQIEQDFVITTVRLAEKNRPIVKIAPFPTEYQLEQLGRLVMLDRTRPYILERFFSEQHFMIIEGEITQEALFSQVCQQLEQEGYVPPEFYPSLVERETIVSTLLGEHIALPHSLGLMARKTVVVTILAPQGIAWGSQRNERAQVIFLLAICKEEYEEAMAIYDLFVTFVREKATRRLLNSQNFAEFQRISRDSLGRIA